LFTVKVEPCTDNNMNLPVNCRPIAS